MTKLIIMSNFLPEFSFPKIKETDDIVKIISDYILNQANRKIIIETMDENSIKEERR